MKPFFGFLGTLLATLCGVVGGYMFAEAIHRDSFSAGPLVLAGTGVLAGMIIAVARTPWRNRLLAFVGVIALAGGATAFGMGVYATTHIPAIGATAGRELTNLSLLVASAVLWSVGAIALFFAYTRPPRPREDRERSLPYPAEGDRMPRISAARTERPYGHPH